MEKFSQEKSTAFWHCDEQDIVSCCNHCSHIYLHLSLLLPSSSQEFLPPYSSSPSESDSDDLPEKPAFLDENWALNLPRTPPGNEGEVDMSDLWVADAPPTEAKTRKYSFKRQRWVQHTLHYTICINLYFYTHTLSSLQQTVVQGSATTFRSASVLLGSWAGGRGCLEAGGGGGACRCA